MKIKLFCLLLLTFSSSLYAEPYQSSCNWYPSKKAWGYFELTNTSYAYSNGLSIYSGVSDYTWVPCNSIPEVIVVTPLPTPKAKNNIKLVCSRDGINEPYECVENK